jgi:hypothetical protein
VTSILLALNLGGRKSMALVVGTSFTWQKWHKIHAPTIESRPKSVGYA